MSLLKKLAISIFYQFTYFWALLFIPAGTLDWWRAWFFLAVVITAVTLTFIFVFPGNEELLNERFKPVIQKDQPLVDKLILIPLLLSYTVAVAVIPLDVFHFHWLPQPDNVISWFGIIAFIAGWWMVGLTFKENTFAAPVVKYQEERHQRVIDTGVYQVVRHPMYAGALLLFFGMPLWLQSYTAALATLIPTILLLVRIHFEEKFLRQMLTGYTDYCHRVRYRVIPLVW